MTAGSISTSASAQNWTDAFGAFGRVCFFENVNFKGSSFCVTGIQRVENLKPSGWSDQISSVLVEGPMAVTLYRNAGYKGRSLKLRNSVADLRLRTGWNDATTSFATSIEFVFPGPPPVPAPRGQVCFFENVNYAGDKLCVRTGRRVANLIPSGWNDRISSVAVGQGARASIFEDVRLGGAQLNLTASNPDLRKNGWNDRASSLRVRAR